MILPAAKLQPSPALRQEHRKKAFARLQGLVEFVPLYRGSKVPSSKYSDPSERFQKLPRTVNVGAYPIGRTVILDIDRKGELQVEEEVAFLEELMTPRLRQTFTVATPSGGLHLYLLWPEGVALPHNGKLARLGLGVTGDVRAAGVNGQCVLAGSVVGGHLYQVLEDRPLLALQEGEVADFMAGMRGTTLRPSRLLVRRRQETFRERQSSPPPQKALEAPPPAKKTVSPPTPTPKRPFDDSLKLVPLGEEAPLSPLKLALLKGRLTKRAEEKYYIKRALVYNLLSCCETPATIKSYWHALDIARDTYRGRGVSDYSLQRELSRLTPATTHSSLCTVVRARRAPRELTLEEARDKVLQQLKRHHNFYSPQVISPEAVQRVLLSGRQKPGKAYPLAWALVEDFLQPWSNWGVRRIVLGESFLSTHYNVTAQEVRAAKGLLLRRGVMKTVVKQAPGRAAAFSVSPSLILPHESRLLRAYRQEGEEGLYLPPRGPWVVTPLTGELVDTFENLEGPWLTSLPPRLREGTVVDHILAGSDN